MAAYEWLLFSQKILMSTLSIISWWLHINGCCSHKSLVSVLACVLCWLSVQIFIVAAYEDNSHVKSERWLVTGRNYQYYKVIRVFVSLYVCLSVCLSLYNSGTDGLIWLNLFFCYHRLCHRIVLGQKFTDLGSGFSENLKNPILMGNYTIFL